MATLSVTTSTCLISSPLLCLLIMLCAVSSATVTPPPDGLNLWADLPSDWSSTCDVNYDADPDVNATLTCRPTKDDAIWRLADLRHAINETLVNALKLEIAVDIQCETGGTISLPFPMRSPGVVKLTVLNCQLLDKYADFQTSAERMGDWTRELDMRNCVWLNDPEDLEHVLANYKNVSSHYECGQDSTLVSYIYRNITDRDMVSPCDTRLPSAFLAFNLTYPADIDQLMIDEGLVDKLKKYAAHEGGKMEHCIQQLLEIFTFLSETEDVDDDTNSTAGTAPPSTTKSPLDDALDTALILKNYKPGCVFEHTEIYDESMMYIQSKQHIRDLIDDTKFPELRILNFSRTGLREIPQEILEWRVYFAESKLQQIDLSHCQINKIGHFIPYSNRKPFPTILDLQYNQISTLTLEKIEDLAYVRDFYVDIRNNPMICSCDMKPLIVSLNNATTWAKPSMTYYRQQLALLTCASPPQLAHRSIASLSVEELGCPVVHSAGMDFVPVVASLVVLVVVLGVMLVVAVIYRREIQILLYTRMDIIVPCSRVGRPSLYAKEKKFDAFVAYAHQDVDWVLESLVKRLEDPGNSKGRHACRLCIHQRDFVVGRPIVDNIIDSIAASRHTIVVLSKHFIKSQWAMEELTQAFHQSLEERTKHLILIELEDVTKEDMGPVLNRCRKTFTYINVSDTFFWDKLLYSITVGLVDGEQPAKINLEKSAEKYDNICYSPDDKGPDTKGDIDMETGEAADIVQDTGFDKKALFSESMRTVSVDSGVSMMTVMTNDLCPSPVDDVNITMPDSEQK